MPVEQVYHPSDSENEASAERLGEPGAFPFTRGIYPSMYRGRLWTMRQYAGYADATESNGRYRYMLEQGQTGLSVAFDLPTQLGYDPDHPLAVGEVGRVGVSIASADDMADLFRDIPLDQVSTSMTINATAAVLLAFYIVAAEEQGVAPGQLGGTLQNDIFKEYVARGTYIYPPEPSLRLVTDTIEYCVHHLPRWNPISISGYHLREAGATAVQELAFTLANGIGYVRAAIDRGLSADNVGRQVSFFFSCDRDFFEEIAKFRAARRLWATIMRDDLGAREPRSSMLRFHTQTAGSSLTAQQPQVNTVRTAVQALAAVLGGTQSLHCNAWDEALALPSEDSARLALRTQQVLAHETGVTATVDPLAGSYFVESLTDQLEANARDELIQIGQLGGALAAVRSGHYTRAIEESAYRAQQAVERGHRTVVGVNKYRDGAEAQSRKLLRVDPAVRDRQSDRLTELRLRRDQQRVTVALEQIRETAAGEGNLVEALLAGARARATLGEMCDALRRVFGEHQP
ncbi:MAG: methylmalonyl-CoA mutase [Dehalococcoidia bacterium]|nr:methylmalonyl-CoA mutase [Dehalococcoidia bacterium]